jgi:hypothetical protein
MARSKADSGAAVDADGPVGEAGEPTEAATEVRVNKSEEIRSEARQLLDTGRQPRPSEIVRLLGARDIVVAPAMVSTVLKKMGVRGRPRRSPAVKRSTPPPREPAAAGQPSPGESFTLEQLIAAKQFVETVGSPKQAMALLDALDQLL